jgi:hypothetical protein
MAADGSNIIPLRSSREVAWKAGLRVVEGHPQAPAGLHDFSTPRPGSPSFRNVGGLVYLRTARLAPDAVEALLQFFQREASRTGDWTAHDELMAARDGITDPQGAA